MERTECPEPDQDKKPGLAKFTVFEDQDAVEAPANGDPMPRKDFPKMSCNGFQEGLKVRVHTD